MGSEEIISAGTESKICEQCYDGSTVTTFTINPPHPKWTNLTGGTVVLLDAVALGGMFGLNN